MRIMGLDPGSIHTGFGIIQAEGSRVTALAMGRLSCPRSEQLPARLARLATEANGLIARWQPDLVAIETPYRGLNSRSLIVLAEARGALLATVSLAGAEIREFSPAEVKSAVAGGGRADKDQVARMARLLLRLGDDPLSHDATDALAVALCCAYRLRMDNLGRGSSVCKKLQLKS
jgi:crossover junction endodeoxyribonuclease RuvC